MKFHTLIIYFVFVAITTISSSAQVRENDKIAVQLDDYLTRISGFGFSGAVIVERNNRVVLRKGYGFSNVSKKVPFTPDTPMFVASIQKQFTAAAILALEKDGKLKTGDAIGKFIKNAPDDKKQITVHQMLTHTSGMGNSYAGSGLFKREDAVKVLLAAPLINPIGAKMVYSNDAYELLGALVEIISGENLHTFIRKSLFKPSGMESAGFEGDGNFWGNDKVAHAYNSFADSGSPQFTKRGWDGHGSGSLVVSANDLFKWELSIREDRVLSGGIKKKMFTPYSEYPNGWKYGYGWFVVSDEPGKREYYHGGGDSPRGFTASYNRYPDSNSTIIIYSNAMIDDIGFVNVVKPVIVDIAFGKKVDMPPYFSKVQDNYDETYAGLYCAGSGERFVIQFEDSQLRIGAVDQEAINFLTTPTEDTSKKLRQFNKLSTEFAENMTGDKSGSLSFQDSLASLEKQHGKFKKYAVLGTYPVSEVRELAATYMKLEFENGHEVVRFVRIRGGIPYPLMGTDYPALTPIMPQTNGTFLAYYPVLKKSVGIRFEIGKNENTTGIKLNNGTKEISASKLCPQNSGTFLHPSLTQ